MEVSLIKKNDKRAGEVLSQSCGSCNPVNNFLQPSFVVVNQEFLAGLFIKYA